MKEELVHFYLVGGAIVLTIFLWGVISDSSVPVGQVYEYAGTQCVDETGWVPLEFDISSFVGQDIDLSIEQGICGDICGEVKVDDLCLGNHCDAGDSQNIAKSSKLYYIDVTTNNPTIHTLMRDTGISAFDYFDVYQNQIIVVLENSLEVWNSDGTMNEFNIPNIYDINRPSISPDGKYIAVQASDISWIDKPQDQEENLDIYVLSLIDGSSEKISQLPFNEENPVWARNNVIYYNSFSMDTGITIHGFDMMTKTEVFTLPIDSFHLDVSKDSRLLLNSIKGQIIDINSKQTTMNFRPQIHSTLVSQGYTLDTRFDGQAALGSCPLSGVFTDDSIIVDCAVQKNGEYGIVLLELSQSTNTINIIKKLLPYQTTEENRFSPLSLQWI